jgi:hypothetical protein
MAARSFWISWLPEQLFGESAFVVYLTYSRQEIGLQPNALAEWTRSTAGHRRSANLG